MKGQIMIDIKLLRSDREIFYSSCKARGFNTDILDEFFSLDSRWRENLKILNECRHKKNMVTSSISTMIKKGEDIDSLKPEVQGINKKISDMEEEQKGIEAKRNEIVRLIPNLLADDVPICSGDENSKIVKYFGNSKVYNRDLDYFMENSNNSKNYTIKPSWKNTIWPILKELER